MAFVQGVDLDLEAGVGFREIRFERRDIGADPAESQQADQPAEDRAAEVVDAADVLREAALAAETRAAHSTGPERQRALNEAERLWSRERHLRSLAPRAELREITSRAA